MLWWQALLIGCAVSVFGAVTYGVGYVRGKLRVYRQLEEVTVAFMAEWLGEKDETVSGTLIVRGDENGFHVEDAVESKSDNNFRGD